MAFSAARGLLASLDQELGKLHEIKVQLEHDLVLKSETLARLEAKHTHHTQDIQAQQGRMRFAFGAGAGIPKLKPTQTKESKPGFPAIEPESSECSEILAPHVYLAGNIVARDLGKLKQAGITHVLNVASGVIPNYFPKDFVYTSFELIDAPGEEIDYFILHAIAEIEQCLLGGGRMLVHCHQGASRSATLVIAYVAWKLDLSVVDALFYVKARRSIVSPNQGFLDQLTRFDERRRRPREPYSVHHLTQHSQHESSLVLKQVLAQDSIDEASDGDVYIAVERNEMMVREPKNMNNNNTSDGNMATALKLAKWMEMYDLAYRGVRVVAVPHDSAEFAQVVRRLPMTTVTAVTTPQPLEHIMSQQQ